MSKGKAVRKPSNGHRQAEPEAELRPLLDHLGRLLAREYVALLSASKSRDTDERNPTE